MSVGVKASIIVIGGAILFYVAMFLVSLPIMASSSPMAQAMGASMYASLYKPVRDVLPSGYFVLELWQDYERYWCATAEACEL